MNRITQDGLSITQTNDSITVNGKEYEIPEKVRKYGKNTMTVLNGKITINGFEFNPKTGEFTEDYSFWWIMLIVIASAIAAFSTLNL